MEIRNLITFIKINDTKSFTKAAADLGYSQSAVTAQIKALEKELGVPVFNRIGKSISLTAAGVKLLNYANQILTLEQSAIADIKDPQTMTGKLRMAIAESLSIAFLPDILFYYRHLHPEVDLIVKSADSCSMFQMLKENHYDLVYTIDKLYDRPEFSRPRELAEPILFIAPVNHPLSRQTAVSLAELCSQPFIFPDYDASYRTEFESQMEKKHVFIQPFLEVQNTDIICRLVSKGVGLSFVPACVAKPYITEGLVVQLNVPDIQITMYRQLLYAKNKYQTPQMQAMIKLLTEIDF